MARAFGIGRWHDPTRRVDVVAATDYDEVLHALEESLKLQSHYAYLLNAHDGGERIGFATADKWIARLRETSNRSGKHG
jgi:hypothetical protein